MNTDDLFDLRLEILSCHLEASVPIEINALHRRLLKEGREVDNDLIEQAQACMRTLREPNHSEAIEFPMKGLTREMVRLLTECLAVMAHQPGGVTAFGCHFEVPPEKMHLQRELSPAEVFGPKARWPKTKRDSERKN